MLGTEQAGKVEAGGAGAPRGVIVCEAEGGEGDGLSRRHVGQATVIEEHGEPRVVEGACLAATDERVHAIRVGGDAGEPVWIRALTGGTWRRGRVAIADDRVEFRDEAAATEALSRDVSPVRGGALLEAAVLASVEVRAKARASEVYAGSLYIALAGRAWGNVSGEQAELGDRQAEGIVGALTGRGFSRIAAYWANAEIVDAKVLDEEVAGDIAALGWTPGGASDDFGRQLLARRGRVPPAAFGRRPSHEEVSQFTAAVDEDRARGTPEREAAIDAFLREVGSGEKGWRARLAGLPATERERLEREFERRVEREHERLARPRSATS